MVRCLLHEKLVLPDDLYVHMGAYITRNIKRPEGTRILLHHASVNITMAVMGDEQKRAHIHEQFPEIIISD